MIEMKPIEGSMTLMCPFCSAPRLQVHSDGLEVIGGRYWLNDGDTISQLWQKLTAEQKEPDNFEYEMLVGKCTSCGEHYYVAEAGFMSGPRELTEPYLHRNTEPASERFLTCTSSTKIDGCPATWLCQVSETPHGPMHTHTFGPFRLESMEGVIGRNGVAACASSSNAAWHHSTAILSGLWDEMRKPFMPPAQTPA